MENGKIQYKMINFEVIIVENVQPSPYEQVRQVAASLAIENMYAHDDVIEKALQIAEGTVDVEDVIKELIKKYERP